MTQEIKEVKFEMVEDGIALVTLNRPERRNAYTPQMGYGLMNIFQQSDEDDAVRVIVVTGAGSAFCVGADMAAGEDTFNYDARGGTGQIPPDVNLPSKLKKPIIAAINGHAVGVGLTLPLNWDIRIVAQEAKLSFPFVGRGIVPEAGSTWILPHLVGLSRALDLLLTGRIFMGSDAADYGLALEALPADQVLPRALEIARNIRDNAAPVSVALTKMMVWKHLATTSLEEASAREGRGVHWTGSRADAKEGVMAFLEKRKPQWSLRPSTDWPDLD